MMSKKHSAVETVSSAPEAPSKSRRLNQAIGEQVRMLRKHQGLQVTELAERARISAALVSRIEHGGVSPSLQTMDQIATALAVPITHLFSQVATRSKASLVRNGEGLKVIRSGTRAKQIYQLLGAPLNGNVQVEPYLITLGEDAVCNKFFQHEGTELIYMLKGTLVYRHGEDDYKLNVGDSLFFDARVSHGTVKLIELPAQFLSVISYQHG